MAQLLRIYGVLLQAKVEIVVNYREAKMIVQRRVRAKEWKTREQNLAQHSWK